MKAAMGKLEAQLKLWGREIDRLAARTQTAGARARFEDLMYVDELKAFYAIAQSKFDEFKAPGDSKRAGLEAELNCALNELGAAFKSPKPSP